MATTPSRYSLGAPSSMLLDFNTSNPADLGSSMGGVTVTLKPSVFKAVSDQTIGNVAAWRTMEEATIEFSCPEITVPNLLIAVGYDPSLTTTVATGTLSALTGCTVGTIVGGASGAYTYKVFAYTNNADGIPQTAAITTSVGPTTLSTTNTITLNLGSLPTGAVGFGIERTSGGPSQGLLGRIDGSATTYVDSGQAGTTYTEAVAQPTYSTKDTGYSGGTVSIPIHQLDLVCPRNRPGLNQNIRYTFWKVFSEGSPVVDFKRDKNSEMKIMFSCLSDTTRTLGQQLFRKVVEYGTT